MASLKMMRFSNVLPLVLSVGAKRRPRTDMSSVEWSGKLKCLETLLSGSLSCSSFRWILCVFARSVVKLSGGFANIQDITFAAGDTVDDA